MTKTITAAAALLALAAPAFAQSMDADGDGNVTLEEAQAAYPDMTAETFASIDSDADGVLSAEEVQAATEAGVLPPCRRRARAHPPVPGRPVPRNFRKDPARGGKRSPDLLTLPSGPATRGSVAWRLGWARFS